MDPTCGGARLASEPFWANGGAPFCDVERGLDDDGGVGALCKAINARSWSAMTGWEDCSSGEPPELCSEVFARVSLPPPWDVATPVPVFFLGAIIMWVRGVVRRSPGRWRALQWPEITGGGEEEVKVSLERERLAVIDL
ncbi:hypothetical protein CsSME_00012150 [Camellia sinensis var. sinensis]